MEEQGGSGRLLRRTPVGGFCLESSLVVQVIPNHSAFQFGGGEGTPPQRHTSALLLGK